MTASAANVLLAVDKLRVAYGGIQAVKGVSFEVREGELVSLIGANGAGKTTTLKAITGLQPTAAGTIEFLGKTIVGQGAWDLVKQGLVMVPEGRGTFTRMTITENLQMGAFIRTDTAQVDVDIEKVFAIFPRLKERRNQLAFLDLEGHALHRLDAAIRDLEAADLEQCVCHVVSVAQWALWPAPR